MAKQTSVTKTKDRAASEAKLLEAAEKIFAQVGYEGATTRMIAQEAGINLSLINRYFNGKYGLLIALVQKSSEDFIKQELTYPKQTNVRDELVLFGEFMLSRYIDSENLIKVCFVQFLSDPKFLKEFRDMILNQTTHPEILTRLKALDAAKNKKTDFVKLVEEIEIHAIGKILTSLIVEGKSVAEVHKSFKEFLVNYSKHLEI